MDTLKEWMAKPIGVNGFHVTVGFVVLVVALVLVWRMAKS